MVGGDPPRGFLLREPRSPYFVEEEEIPRAVVFVQRSWQRARWIDGRTFVWVGRRKTALYRIPIKWGIVRPARSFEEKLRFWAKQLLCEALANLRRGTPQRGMSERLPQCLNM
jgi:hypothetical protein